MFATVLSVFSTGLSLWEHKEKTKYADSLMDIKRRYYEESNKPNHERSDAVLDNLEFELRNLAAGFAASATK